MRRLGNGVWPVLFLAASLQAAGAQPLDAEDAIQEGRGLVASGHPAAAIPVLQRAVQTAPSNPAAHYALAEAYFRSGDLMNALSSLKVASALSNDPTFRQNADAKAQAIEAKLAQRGAPPTEISSAPVTPPPAMAPPVTPPLVAPAAAMPAPAAPASAFDEVDAALRAGDLDKAHILALTALRNDPTSARGNYLLAEILVRKKDISGARKAYEDALNGSNLPPARKEEIERKLLRLEVAMEPGLASATEEPPASSAPAAAEFVTKAEDTAYHSPLNVASAMAARGDLQGAIRELRAYVATNPSDQKAHVALARYLLDSGDNAAALDELRAAITLAPGDDIARNQRASLLMARGDYAGALADLDAVVVSGRATAVTYSNRGVANQHLGDLDLALQDYDKAIALDPANTTLSVNKGSVLIAKRQEQTAIEVLTAAIARGATTSGAFLYRGIAYFNMGQFNPAIGDFSKVIELDPANRQALLYRAQAYKVNNAYGPALLDLDRLVALDPANTDALMLRGTYRAAQGQYREAIADYDAVLARKPGYAEAVTRRTLANNELARSQPQ
jgi:tetratricopeptide (TPR) repeat protein